MTICHTVAELIAALQRLPPDTIPYAAEPPFTGVKLVEQDDGRVFVASLRDTPEGQAWREAYDAAPLGASDAVN